MIIESVSLKNFGVFGDEQHIDLAPPSAERPVVLVGGINGTGKTTILEALHVCLYGKLASTERRRGRAYPDYLKALYSRNAGPLDEASVAICFRCAEEGQERRYRIRRSWSTPNGRVKENFEASVDGKPDDALSRSWDEQVERFMPHRLCHLFFFDGERIRGMADSDKSGGILRTAVESLLGLGIVEQLRTDLKALRNRRAKDIISGPDKDAVSALESELKSIVKARREEIGKKTRIERRLAKADRDFEDADRIFKQKGGHLQERHEELEAQHAECGRRLQALAVDLLRKAEGALPLTMVAEAAAGVLEQAIAERDAERARDLSRLLSEHDERFLKCLAEAAADKEVLTAAHDYVESERTSREDQLQVELYLDLSENGLSQAQALLGGGLASEQAEARGVLEQYLSKRTELDEIESALGRIPDEGTLKDIIDRRQKTADRRAQLQQELHDVVEAETRLAQKRDDIARKLDELLRQAKTVELESEDARRFLEHTDRMQQLMAAFRARLLAQHVSRLEDLVLDRYRQLMHKQSLVGSVRIDPESCRLSLFNTQGLEIPSDSLSAGERQLLAVSILWGLATATGRAQPVVIDTPLGRLDGEHRDHLVERYFPRASHEVILLSTDEEIDGTQLKKLRETLGHSYVLTYDEDSESSSVAEGYFW